MNEVPEIDSEKMADMVYRMMRRFRPAQVQCEKPTIEGTLISHLNLLQSVIMRRANSAVAVEGLTFQQWLALGAIAHQGEEGIRHSDLGDRLRLSKAPVTGMVDRLERAGWVVRKPDADDRRVSRIVVTDEGISTWQRAHGIMRNSSMELFSSLNETKKYQLLTILEDLLSKAGEADDLSQLSEEGFTAVHYDENDD